MRTLGISCAVGGAVVGSAGAHTSGRDLKRRASRDIPEMEYRTLGRTGLQVSAVSFGVMRLTDPAVLLLALESGINYFDTAHRYQNGNNEKMLGNVLKEYGREKALIATKIPPYVKRPSGYELAESGDMEEMVDTSLQRLQTDYVDVLLLHNIKDASWPGHEDMMSFLEKQKKSGKARFLGISFHVKGSLYVDIVNHSLKTGFYDVLLATLNFKSPPDHVQALMRARSQDVGVVAMKTQAGGYAEGEGLGPNANRAALKWALEQEYVDCAIPGMVNREQLLENLLVAGKKTRWSDRKSLHTYYASIQDRYCTGCGACSGTCGNNVDIPGIHRSLIYGEGYGDPDLAREAYRELMPWENASACIQCSHPTCRCANGMALRERLCRAHRLFG
jgi:hypothetical protein